MIESIFFGTPAAAGPTLRRLARHTNVKLVVTQPDRPRRRSARPVPPAVKVLAQELGLSVVQPETRADLSHLADVAGEADVGVVVAYGMIIPAAMLAVPRRGFINLHFSLLPRWRGAAPVQHAMLAGDTVTGASIMKLDQGMDTGPVAAVRSTRITPADTAGSVTERLARRGADVLAGLIPPICEGRVSFAAQTGEATYAPKITPADRRLDFAAPATALARRVMAMSPEPGAWATLGEGRLKVMTAFAHGGHDLAPGHLRIRGNQVECGTGDGILQLGIVQPAGKRPMPAGDWARGRRGEPGVLT